MASKHRKKCLSSLINRKLKIKNENEIKCYKSGNDLSEKIGTKGACGDVMEKKIHELRLGILSSSDSS